MKCFHLLTFIVIAGAPGLSSQQRVPPGVPPQHYQPPPQYQQQQQQPDQAQQVPGQIPYQNIPHTQGQVYPPGQAAGQVGQQQVPASTIPPNVPQPPVQQQPPVNQHSGHANPGHGHGYQQPILGGGNVLQERDHIKEHMDVPIDTSQMSEQELQFHYFKMHDSDQNNKLDGTELIKSLIHWHHEDLDKNSDTKPEHKVFQDDEFSKYIDPILTQDDKNHDGYIDYAEFVQAQANAVAANQQNNQHAG